MLFPWHYSFAPRISRGAIASSDGGYIADIQPIPQPRGWEPSRLRPPGRSRAPQSAGSARAGEAVPDPPVPPPGRALRSEPGGRTLSDYHINVFYSEEDGGYIADIPDLETCSAFGASPEEALAEVAKAKEAWLAAARDTGRPIPKPRYRPAIYAR
jgi:predicted RNase H-like HicB family nuclease